MGRRAAVSTGQPDLNILPTRSRQVPDRTSGLASFHLLGIPEGNLSGIISVVSSSMGHIWNIGMLKGKLLHLGKETFE